MFLVDGPHHHWPASVTSLAEEARAPEANKGAQEHVKTKVTDEEERVCGQKATCRFHEGSLVNGFYVSTCRLEIYKREGFLSHKRAENPKIRTGEERRKGKKRKGKRKGRVLTFHRPRTIRSFHGVSPAGTSFNVRATALKRSSGLSSIYRHKICVSQIYIYISVCEKE